MELIKTSEKSSPQRRAPLEVFFRPRNVAVIGATENQLGVGRSLVSNLMQTPFGGSIYPVNPNHSAVLGLRCYPNVHETPEKIDLAVIATPARTVPGIVRECVAAGSRARLLFPPGLGKPVRKGRLLSRKSSGKHTQERCASLVPTASAS
jgi:acetyltransferase